MVVVFSEGFRTTEGELFPVEMVVMGACKDSGGVLFVVIDSEVFMRLVAGWSFGISSGFVVGCWVWRLLLFLWWLWGGFCGELTTG